MTRLAPLLLVLATPALGACTTAGHHAANYPEATPYDSNADAISVLAAARAAAALADRKVLAIFGADWCHDSRALAGWLQSPGLAPLVEAHFAVAYIHAGVPQTGEGMNLHLAEDLGVTAIEGTPTMLVLDADGTLLNTPDDARNWRNASTRDEAAIRAWLESWLEPGEGFTPQ